MSEAGKGETGGEKITKQRESNRDRSHGIRDVLS